MNEWKVAVEMTKTQLISKGYRPQLAHKCALKRCKHLHPAHKVATVRRVEMADLAAEATGEFHSL